MTAGWFSLMRDWQDHPLFGNDEYSRRDAWAWLIANACFRKTQCGIDGTIIALSRGQLSYSVRFLAEKWHWSKTRVGQYLKKLENAGMIAVGSKTGTVSGTAKRGEQLIITICNYDKYQPSLDRSALPTGTLFGTEAGQRRDKEENVDKYTPKGDALASQGSIQKKLFDIGKEFLSGFDVSHSVAGAFFGEMRKAFKDDGLILSAIMAAQEEDRRASLQDPRAWIRGWLKNRQGSNEQRIEMN